MLFGGVLQSTMFRINKQKNKRGKPKRDEEYPHFRRYKVNNHPALIVQEHSQEEYDYRKVMHSDHDGKHLNEKVEPNPNPADPKPMYITKRIRHDKKNRFDKKLPWKYPKKSNKKK